MVKGLCEPLMFPRVFGGVQSAAVFSKLFSILLINDCTLLLVVSLRIESGRIDDSTTPLTLQLQRWWRSQLPSGGRVRRQLLMQHFLMKKW